MGIFSWLIFLLQEAQEMENSESKEKVKASDAKAVKLLFQIPPIDKMDASLSTLANCEWVFIICIIYNTKSFRWIEVRCYISP